ncbi:MAG: pyrroline-5-carboxylate reductase [Cyclobacteriaceae bacterium]|nr:pyrroline-5-carboxylate reductase [Cyclobacteriaceae bacterium]MCH8516976.1 pyrroline-5-carboxylate reductase [Cyclobacteriaceae bacterium]
MKIAVIGCGNMGYALIRGILSGYPKLSQLDAVDAVAEIFDGFSFHEKLKKNVVLEEAIAAADVIMLAVKPADADALIRRMKPHLSKQQRIVSVMAGISTTKLASKLGVSKVVRVMPNLPAKIRKAVLCYYATAALSDAERAEVDQILSCCGKTIFVREEGLLDAATAISGTGPAYVFFLMDVMMKQARFMGFDEVQAQELVMYTLMGSSDLIYHEGVSPQTLIARVASKGGTTEAALHVLEQKAVADDIGKAIQAALARSKELGNNEA